MSAEEVVTLYRPVGQAELDLIKAANFKKFPPRLPEQPIFYPVLNESYAEKIARDWNTKDSFSGYVGYVTRFSVRKQFIDRYEVQTVGRSGLHEEYWILADDLEEMNSNIVGVIEVLSEFRKQDSNIRSL